MPVLNKTIKKEIHPLITIAICLIIVSGVAFLLNNVRQNFETNQVVSAETLKSFTNIRQNQREKLLNDGYLTVNAR